MSIFRVLVFFALFHSEPPRDDNGDMALGVLDYAVLSVTLLVSGAIGVYYGLTGGKQQTTQVKHFYYLHIYGLNVRVCVMLLL